MSGSGALRNDAPQSREPTVVFLGSHVNVNSCIHTLIFGASPLPFLTHAHGCPIAARRAVSGGAAEVVFFLIKNIPSCLTILDTRRNYMVPHPKTICNINRFSLFLREEILRAGCCTAVYGIALCIQGNAMGGRLVGMGPGT